MIRPRALVAAVPQQVWAAVIGLVLLGSVGVAVVVGAGLSTWRGAVGASARPPAVVASPPSTGVVVVPSQPTAPRRATQPPQHVVPPGAPARVTNRVVPAPTRPSAAPTVSAAASAPLALPTPPVVLRPRLAGITIDTQALLAALERDLPTEHPRGRALGHLKQHHAKVPHARTAKGVVRRAAARAHRPHGHVAAHAGHGRVHARHGHGC